jgi:hypothetical protein
MGGEEPKRAFEPSSGRNRWRRLETWLIVLVALHSTAVGIGALIATEWGVRFAGWEGAAPLFFPRQVGVFHVVVASAYLIEYFRYGGVIVVLTTKAIAVAFLVAMMAVDSTPWVVPFSAAGDGLMVLAILAIHRMAAAGRETRGAGST